MHHGLRVIRPADITAQPWANGLGATRVIMECPAWRISIAEITGRMPFSGFPGMDRTLIPLTADGLVLDVAGERHVVSARTPLRFRGEAPVFGDTGSQAARVVNVMVQRTLSRLRCDIVDEPDVLTAGIAAIVVLSPQLSLDGAMLTPGTVIVPSFEAPAILTFDTYEASPTLALLH